MPTSTYVATSAARRYNHGMRRVVIGVLAIAAPAGAQSINVSFGHDSGAPSASYAAAGGAGTWNAVTGVAGSSFDLVAVDGSPSGVTVSQSPTTTVLTATDGTVSGDDATLLDNGLVTTGAETCLMFANVAAGTYEVLVYAWVPGQASVLSRTRQDEAPSTIDVGGAWTGAHVEGVTYARYVVTVDGTGMLPAHSGLVPGAPSAALNGVQIRPFDSGGGGGGGGGGTDAGTAGGGGGGDASTDAPAHAGGCQTGPDAGIGLALGLAALVRRRRATS